MRVESWPASDRDRLVAASQWAMVLTVAVTFSHTSADSGLVPATAPPVVPSELPDASATGAAAFVEEFRRANSTVSEPVEPDQDNGRGPMTFWGAAMFQWVNAKGWVMVIGTITAYAAIAAYPWNIVIQVGLSLLLGVLSCTAWAFFGSALRPILTSRRAVRTFNMIMAVLLLASLYPVFMDA